MTIYTTRRLFGKLILQENGKDAKDAPDQLVAYVKPRPPLTGGLTGGARPESTGPAQATGTGVEPVSKPKK